MLKKIPHILFLLVCLKIIPAYANWNGDTTKKCIRVWRENHHIDLSTAIGEGVLVSSLQWDKLFPIALKKRIKIGFGTRMNIANYWDKSFYTAPPQRINNSFDTLTMAHQTVFFFNLQFLAEVALLKWWDVGMNIDLVGISWGARTIGNYYSTASGYSGTSQTALPENLNLMLFGNNDFGNLNSQFYFRFWPSDKVFVKAGMSLATFTILTDAALNNGNSRFHAGSYMGFVSLGWTPGRNSWIPCKSKTK